MEIIPWPLIIWIAITLLAIFCVAWLSNRPKSLADLDHDIAIARARLDNLLLERARRTPSNKPSFHDLQHKADQYDN